MMKLVDSSIELVVSGTSLTDSETYLEWDRLAALEAVGGFADYISTHRYLDNYSGDSDAFWPLVRRLTARSTKLMPHVDMWRACAAHRGGRLSHSMNGMFGTAPETELECGLTNIPCASSGRNLRFAGRAGLRSVFDELYSSR